MHRRRDVVELQIEEHAVAEVGERTDRLGPGGTEELEPDLRGAEPRPQQASESDRLDEIVDIERERQPIAGRDLLWHELIGLHAQLPRGQ